MAANLLGLVFFVIGGVLILTNFAIWYGNYMNRRRGSDKHISSISLIPQFAMILSALAFNAAKNPWLAAWFALCAGAIDPALWMLLFQTLDVVRNRPGKNRE